MTNYMSANHRLLHDIYQTAEVEIQCDAAQDLIARCADALLPEDALPQEYPQLWHHLQVCVDCATEYKLTLELALREATGELSRPAHIPPTPTLEPERPFWKRAAQVLRVAFPGFAPALWVAVRSGSGLLPEPASLNLGGATLILDIAVNADDPTTRDLLLTLDDADAEGTPLALQEGNAEGPVVQEQVCDILGAAWFNNIMPGTYAVRVLWRGCEYWVQDILIP